MTESRFVRIAALAISGLAFLVACAFLFDWLPILRGCCGWVWDYVELSRQTVERLWPIGGVIAVYLVGLRILWKRSTIGLLVWTAAGAAMISTISLYIVGHPLFHLYTRTLSPVTTGAYTTGTRIQGLKATLERWPLLMASGDGLPGHISTSPPAWPTLYNLLSRMLALAPGLSDKLAEVLRSQLCDDGLLVTYSNAQIAVAWFGILLPFWAALTVFPLYALALRLDGKKLARVAVALWPSVLSLALFAATLSTLYPLLATTALALFVYGLTSPVLMRQRALLVVSGVITGVALTFNFAFLPLLVLFGWLALLFTREKEPGQGILAGWRPGEALPVGIRFGLGLLLVFALYRLATGHHLLALLPLTMRQQLDLPRPYLPWLGLNLWDFGLYFGLPLAGLFLLGLIALPAGRLRQMALALFLTLLLLDLSGENRGETGRIWLLFMPALLIVAGAMFLELRLRERRLILLAQLSLFAALLAVIRPVWTTLENEAACFK